MLGPALPSLPRYLTEVVTQIIKHVKVHVVTQIIITLTRSPHNYTLSGIIKVLVDLMKQN